VTGIGRANLNVSQGWAKLALKHLHYLAEDFPEDADISLKIL
jgi:hypothetical protein